MDPFAELPYISKNISGIGGRIREISEDFIVEEIPAYEPNRAGEHLFINLTRSGMNTRYLMDKLASILELKKDDIGYAGLKDRYAVVTQTFSIFFGYEKPAIDDVKEIISNALPVTVNWAEYHSKKIRSGHLRGNKFTIKVNKLDVSISQAWELTEDILRTLKEQGLPNYYGPQRIGVEGNNMNRGYEIIKGRLRLRDRWLNRFLVSSYIDHIFNIYIAERIEKGFYDKLMLGDIAKKASTGGLFVVENLEEEQLRYDCHEINFTAPIYGPKMWFAEKDSEKFERRILEEAEITLEELKKVKVRGSRRVGRINPEIKVEKTDKGLKFQFSLPKGSYATTVLREIMKPSSSRMFEPPREE